MPDAKGITWDLTSYFPEFNGPEMQEFRRGIEERLDKALALATPLGTLAPETFETWEEVILIMEDLQARFSHFSSYVGCLSSADANNEDYSVEQGALGVLATRFEEVGTQFLRALKGTTDGDFEAFLQRPDLAGASHALERFRREAAHSMDTEREVLAARMEVDGLKAWGRLYNTVSGKLEFDMEWPDGRSETLPIARRRSLLENGDRRVRRAAFDGGNRAWKTVEPVTAAAINHIAGSRLTLNRERGITHFLDPALFQMGIRGETLEAMYAAIDGRMDLLRSLAGAKAKLLGQDKLAWYDLAAAVPPEDEPAITWNRAVEMVETSFRAVYPDLADYFLRMLENRWIEAESRKGKRPGAFCTGSHLTRESRVYMTFTGSLGDVRTLAHEVGHAWHHQVMRDLRSMARRYPMTLAESASTFAERILSEGLLADPGLTVARRREISALELSESVVYLLDITTRFRFERAFHEARQCGEVKASTLCAMMEETQRAVLGDILEEGGTDPLYWASKLHFYITGVTFYNFPYTFGFLLSRALYRIFEKEGSAFLPRYEEYLRMTGSTTPEEAVRRSIGEDISTPEFWLMAIDTLSPHATKPSGDTHS
ncbi:MAG: M3 family oligoendopeptidase [Candidatus Sumerlaeia bacterium]|nr:M3 family oligoendopeptidase [Candidatus Sumerlaeia bacterium]